MRKLLRDPLVHFLLIGAGLFAVLSWQGEETDPRRITLSATQVRTALQTMLPGAGYPQTRSELEELIQPLVRDEIFYREALALGLDTNDDQVRTRLIEKMRYVSEDLADPEPANEAQLRELYAANPVRFAAPELVSFEHIFYSPRQRGDAALTDAESAVDLLRSGGELTNPGDSTPLGEEFRDASPERLTILFGEEMTQALFRSPIDEWRGPFESEFGFHLIRVLARSDARQPAFAEVEDQVREAFAEDERAKRNDETWQVLRDRYEVMIEWPEELDAAN